MSRNNSFARYFVLVCLPTTELGRLFFRRRAKQLPLARLVFESNPHDLQLTPHRCAHVITFLHIPEAREIAGFSVKSKGRSFIRGKSIDDSPRISIVDWIIAEGGYPASGYFGGQFKEVVELVEAKASIKMFYNEQRNVLTCVYLFILTAVTHVTQNTSLCRQRQLFRPGGGGGEYSHKFRIGVCREGS